MQKTTSACGGSVRLLYRIMRVPGVRAIAYESIKLTAGEDGCFCAP